MTDLDRIKKLSGILNEEMDKDESVEETDDINRLKHLAGLDEKTGRFPGGKPEILDIPVSVPDAKDDGRFPGGEPEIIKLPKGVEIKYPKPKSPMPGTDDIDIPRPDLDDPRIGRGIDYDEIERRIDRIKGKDDIRRYQFGKLK